MPKLVFDIETIGVDFESLDAKSQELLLANVETDAQRQLVRDGMGLSPLTGRVVAPMKKKF
jgi:hypothetical protein